MWTHKKWVVKNRLVSIYKSATICRGKLSTGENNKIKQWKRFINNTGKWYMTKKLRWKRKSIKLESYIWIMLGL